MKKSFSSLYPYLSWWCENHGYMQIGLGTENDSFLMLMDDGGVSYEDDDSETIDQALKAAEKYLKEVEFPDRFDQETIDEIENG